MDARGINTKLLYSKDYYREKDGWAMVDEWGIKYFMPDVEGHYFDMVSNPLKNSTLEDIKAFKWPDVAEPARFSDMDRNIEEAMEGKNAVTLASPIGNGIMQTCNFLEGYEDFYCDLALGTDKRNISWTGSLRSR